jgi:UDP-N-acetylmuramyl tripeptide synthase
VIVKELEKYLRGREPGEVPAIIESALIDAGAPADAIERADTEMDAVKQALRWAEPGDLILLIVHGKQSEATALLSSLVERGWRPGDPLA